MGTTPNTLPIIRGKLDFLVLSGMYQIVICLYGMINHNYIYVYS